MLKLEWNQPKEHNSNNKNSKHFPFSFKFPGLGVYYRDTDNGKCSYVKSGGGIFIYFFFNPGSWRLFCSSHTKKRTLKKGQVCKKDRHNHRTKKLHLKHRCSHLLLILWLSVSCLGLHLVWSFRWVDTMGLFTNFKLSTCLRLWRLKTTAGQLLGTGTRGIFQEANTVRFSRSWLPSYFYLPITPFLVSEVP